MPEVSREPMGVLKYLSIKDSWNRFMLGYQMPWDSSVT